MFFCGCKFVINNDNEKLVLYEVSFFLFVLGVRVSPCRRDVAVVTVSGTPSTL